MQKTLRFICATKPINSRKYGHDISKLDSRVLVSPFQKMILKIGSSIVSTWNPRRVDMLACCAETLGETTLKKIYNNMIEDSVGRQILNHKPTIETHVDFDELIQLPCNSFGYAYAQFLDRHGMTSKSNLPIKLLEDDELDYVITRCRQIHDYLHVALNIPTNKVGEILLKWVEAINIGLPTSYLAAIIGSAYIPLKHRQNYVQKLLPWAVSNGRIQTKFYLIYWEKMWECDIDQLRQKINITPLRDI